MKIKAFGSLRRPLEELHDLVEARTSGSGFASHSRQMDTQRCSGAAVGQILLSLLDLMAILLMGLIAAAAATQIGQAPASGILSRFSTLLPEDGGALILAASLIGVVLISKSLFSLWLTRRI